MKSTLFFVVTCLGAIGLSAIGLGAIGRAMPVQAEPTQERATDIPVQMEPIQEGGATDLLLPEEKTTEPFEYNTDELDQLSTQINHSISVDNENSVQVSQPSQDSPASDAVVIINSDGSVAGGGEVTRR